MIILHAGRFGKQFFLWGESPVEKEIPVVRRGRKPKKQAAKPYPYDSGFENLSSALELLLDSADRKKTEKINFWIPTIGGNPVPSSPLVAEIPDLKAESALAPWTVHAYPLETIVESGSATKATELPGLFMHIFWKLKKPLFFSAPAWGSGFWLQA